jgi:hypothetical protein
MANCVNNADAIGASALHFVQMKRLLVHSSAPDAATIAPAAHNSSKLETLKGITRAGSRSW